MGEELGVTYQENYRGILGSIFAWDIPTLEGFQIC